MSIKYKILIPIIGALLFGFMLSGAVAWMALNQGNKMSTISQEALAEDQLGAELREKFSVATGFINKVTSMADFVDEQEIKKNYSTVIEPIDQNITDMEQLAHSDTLLNKLKTLRTEFQSWMVDVKLILGLAKGENIPTIEAIDRKKIAIDRLISDISSIVSSETKTSLDNSKQSMNTAMFWAMLLSFAFVLVGSAVSLFLVNGICQPLVDLVRAAERLNAGETSITFAGLERKDEVGAVSRAIAGFKDGVAKRGELEAQANLDHQQQRDRQRAIETLISEFQESSNQILVSVDDKMKIMEQSALSLASLT